jgi:DNA-binding transcriptional LysR family regulator
MSTTALPPDLSRLLAFVRVVEAGSFAEAARRAGTTTSAMSKAVARLEQARGMRLLHRSTIRWR